MSLWWQNNPSLWLLWTVSIPTWVSINTLSCRLCSKWCQTFGGWCTYHQIILTGMDWLLCAFRNFSDHVFLIIREPGYWYQQPLSDYKKCRIAVCSSVAYGTHWDPQWQPDTTEVVITPLQQIHIDNRGQPACRSLMGLGWGCPIDCEGGCPGAGLVVAWHPSDFRWWIYPWITQLPQKSLYDISYTI